MLHRLASLVVRRPRTVLAVTLALLVVAGALGVGAFGRLASGGFDDPGSDSAEVSRLLGDRFDLPGTDVVLVVHAPTGASVDTPAVAVAAAQLAAEVRGLPDVVSVAGYWDAPAPGLRSEDGSAALLAVDLAGDSGDAEDTSLDLVEGLDGPFTAAGATVQVQVGGAAAVAGQIGEVIEADLARAEAIAIPVTFLLLLLVFGSLVAAGLPLVIAAVSVLGSFFTLWLLTQVTDVSVFALNLVTSLGLGLAIDYSLFIVSRFREEVHAGHEVPAAVRRSILTAGRTVLFSGLTVAVSLAALLVFPMFFLRSFAYAGVAVTFLAVVAAIVVLPAVLVVLGSRVNSLPVLRSVRRAPPADGFWFRLSHLVMRRPWPFLLGTLAVLVLLAAPFLRVQFGQTDDRVLPLSTSTAAASHSLRTEFSARDTDPLYVIAPATRTDDPQLTAYLATLRAVPGVTEVRISASDGTGAVVSVVSDVEPVSAAGQELVDAVRAAPTPDGGALVGGRAAQVADSQSALSQRLPWALGFIAVITFVLLFLFTGSVVIPVKALVLNLLSLSATFGAMVFVFQEGHLQGLVGDFQVTGTLDAAMPILMFCVAFGLSMDYEVFLLSRIGEEYRRTGDNTSAVALGLQRTGRLVTSAALLLAVVFLAFATSAATNIKMMGVGVALAVLLDATLVRGLLVPAIMRLAGDWNWWAPRPLRRLHERIGLREDDDAGRVAPAVSPVVSGR